MVHLSQQQKLRFLGIYILGLRYLQHLHLEALLYQCLQLPEYSLLFLKYDLLNLFKKIWLRNDIEILPFDGNGVDKSIAKSEKFLYEVPEYEEMLLEQYEWMKSHSHLYYQYPGIL